MGAQGSRSCQAALPSSPRIDFGGSFRCLENVFFCFRTKHFSGIFFSVDFFVGRIFCWTIFFDFFCSDEQHFRQTKTIVRKKCSSKKNRLICFSSESEVPSTRSKARGLGRFLRRVFCRKLFSSAVRLCRSIRCRKNFYDVVKNFTMS